MNRSGSWLISAVVHGTLLLGTAIAAIGDEVFFERGDYGSGFACEMKGPSVMVDQIDRPRDVFQRGGPAHDSPLLLIEDGIWGSGGGRDAGGDSYWVGCRLDGGSSCSKGTFVPLDWVSNVEEFFFRKQSPINSPSRTARLKIGARRRVLHDLGLEIVCTCAGTGQSPLVRGEK